MGKVDIHVLSPNQNNYQPLIFSLNIGVLEGNKTGPCLFLLTMQSFSLSFILLATIFFYLHSCHPCISLIPMDSPILR